MLESDLFIDDHGDRHIYVTHKRKALPGTVEWIDVLWKVGNQEPVDVSQFDGVDCASLSEDGRLRVCL